MNPVIFLPASYRFLPFLTYAFIYSFSFQLNIKAHFENLLSRQEMRLEIVQELIKTDSLIVEKDINLTNVTSKMDGYVATDIRHLVDKAAHLAASEAGER